MGRDSGGALLSTRAHTLVANLITKIEAITPDEQAGAADKFRHAPGMDPDAAISRDRSFALAPTAPVIRDNRYISATRPAVVVLDLVLVVAYQATRNAADRILKDSERLLDALEGFQSEYSEHVLELGITSGTITALDRTILSEFVLSISYSLDLS